MVWSTLKLYPVPGYRVLYGYCTRSVDSHKYNKPITYYYFNLLT